MKKLTTLWMMIVMLGITLPAMATMSTSKMRQNARFLTDRMAYELRLNEMQYNDVYEVNYDFISNIRYIMDDVVRGYPYAVDRYYEYLNYRNEDLSWILSDVQYRNFMNVDYFYRPIYTTRTNWLFRIYRVYRDVNHFYFGKPHHYRSYNGGHFRTHFNNVSFYKHHRKDHYKHEFYKGHTQLRPDKPARPGQHRPEVGRPQHQHPSGNVRPGRPSDGKQQPSVGRPSGNKGIKPSSVNRNDRNDGKQQVNPSARQRTEKKVGKRTNSNEVKQSTRSGNRRESMDAGSRSSKKENTEGRRAVRNR